MAPSETTQAGLHQERRLLPWLEPLAAYRCLRSAGFRPALLDGLGAHPEARHAFLALNPLQEIRVEGDTFTQDGPAGIVQRQGDVVGSVQAALDRTPRIASEEVPFTGGWLGFFGYEFAHLLDSAIPRRDGPRGVPDALLRLYPDVLAFDRRQGTATLYGADLGGDVAEVSRRLDVVVAALHPPSAGSRDAEGVQPSSSASNHAVAFHPRTVAPHQAAAPEPSALPPHQVTSGSRAPRLMGPGGASAPVPRVAIPPPAEVSPIEVSPAEVSPAEAGWASSLDEAAFSVAVTNWKALIHDGDMFQANLATRFESAFHGDPADLFARLQAANPSPFMALLEEPQFAFVSASPELLFAVEAGRIRSRPIAGTRKRGATREADEAMERELLADAKEQAEHTMLVDLVRNDVARVAVPGTVAVPERMSVERYQHVMHLASRVEADVRPGTGFTDWLSALFPGGTVTGAPKVRATERIHAAEPVPRGPYTGSVGYISWSGNACWNILIRTLVLAREDASRADDWNAAVHAGSGIVADSDPPREWREARRKARALLEAAAASHQPEGTRAASRLGEVTLHGAWAPPRPTRRFPHARVLLVDNFDSFVHNLADYFAALGAATRVMRNDVDWRNEVATFRPTHVILSPGPGWPAQAGCSKEMARDLTGRLPILGVCLGHQAIAEAHGARIVVKGPVHGKPDAVLHEGTGLFAGLPSPLTATRYHSLVADEATLPPDWRVSARLADGTVMAIRHCRHPTYGLQFHPESLCTEGGLELLARFLGEMT